MDTIKGIGKRVGLVGTATGIALMGALILMGAAEATPADPVDDAFTTMQGKVTLYGAAVVALVVASVLLFFGIKFLRKGASKA
ncbi:hypothetical protein [Nocardioides sp. HB32]